MLNETNVRVYWNLHKGCWSVQDRKTGRVVKHVEAWTLADVKFTVRPAGRDKVRREGKKNVHAFAAGRFSLKNGLASIVKGARKVTYNPYVNETFVFAETGEPVTDAYVVTMSSWQGKPSVWAIKNQAN